MLKYPRVVLMKLIVFCGVLLLTQSSHVQAVAEVSYSKYRFVFDDNIRKDALLISNRGSSSVSCNASLSHFIMGDNGPTKLADSPDEVANSAEKLLRYSPRQSNIGPNGTQVVRLLSRRRPGIKNGEYISYLKLSCQEAVQKKQKSQSQITVKPQFVHYFPLQVRVGKLTASTHFENARIIKNEGNYKVSVEQYRQGERSIIGDIEVKDKTGDVLGMIKNVAIYPSHSKREHKIKLKKTPKGHLEIIFTEDKAFLGSLVSRIDVNS
jgi:P pilus assembly chaperone PapD